jgi:hypothetical protein
MDEKELLLAEINAELTKHHLQRIERVVELGSVEKGESEIMALKGVMTYPHGLFADVRFDVAKPDDSGFCEHTIRFHPQAIGQDGTGVVTLLNGSYLFVKQWRLAIGRWTTECPRAFGVRAASYEHILRMELEEIMASATTILRSVDLPSIYENTGTSRVKIQVKLVELRADPEALKNLTHRNRAFRLWTPRQVDDQLGEGLCDAHSLAYLHLAEKYLRDHPGLG